MHAEIQGRHDRPWFINEGHLWWACLPNCQRCWLIVTCSNFVLSSNQRQKEGKKSNWKNCVTLFAAQTRLSWDSTERMLSHSSPLLRACRSVVPMGRDRTRDVQKGTQGTQDTRDTHEKAHKVHGIHKAHWAHKIHKAHEEHASHNRRPTPVRSHPKMSQC